MCMSVCVNAAYTMCVQCHRGQMREAVTDSRDCRVLLGTEPVLWKSGQCSGPQSALQPQASGISALIFHRSVREGDWLRPAHTTGTSKRFEESAAADTERVPPQ